MEVRRIWITAQLRSHARAELPRYSQGHPQAVDAATPALVQPSFETSQFVIFSSRLSRPPSIESFKDARREIFGCGCDDFGQLVFQELCEADVESFDLLWGHLNCHMAPIPPLPIAKLEVFGGVRLQMPSNAPALSRRQ